MHGINLLRFQLTIEAQVEGHLHGRLNDNTPKYANHQTTKRIVDAIMLATRQRKDQDERLIQLLREVKRVEYHAGGHSSNFFFTRTAAAKWESTANPFRRQQIKLTDINHAQTAVEKAGEKTEAWSRQLGTDGAKDSELRFGYKVQLLNVVSFMDVCHFLTPSKASCRVQTSWRTPSTHRGPNLSTRSTGSSGLKPVNARQR